MINEMKVKTNCFIISENPNDYQYNNKVGMEKIRSNAKKSEMII